MHQGVPELLRKARRTCRAAVEKKNDDSEELQKKNLSREGRSGSTGGLSSRRPHISTTSTVPAVAHCTYWVAVFEERAMQRRGWTSS